MRPRKIIQPDHSKYRLDESTVVTHAQPDTCKGISGYVAGVMVKNETIYAF